MHLSHGLHLAYCTNIHRGETWAEIFSHLDSSTLAVREKVAPGAPYAIGLRLGERASRELSDPETLRTFQHWLDDHQCYVFTINGFPFGTFHGTRVKEQVYAPDWTSSDRLAYTTRLFDLLARLVPVGVAGSVSTVPCSFKAFIRNETQIKAMRENLWRCVDYIDELSRSSGRDLHLGLEPEPLCFLETTPEAVAFFEAMRADRPGDKRLDTRLGINYDACHLAIEYENPIASLRLLQHHGIKLSKLHLSSALKVTPTPAVRAVLAAFQDPVYFHQVIARNREGNLTRYRDLDVALAEAPGGDHADEEWRIHFHIPLHSQPSRYWDPAAARQQMDFAGQLGQSAFDSTIDHLRGVLDVLRRHPTLCSHLEMETYTWEVLPPELKNRRVVDQLVAEYEWTLAQLAERGFHRV